MHRDTLAAAAVSMTGGLRLSDATRGLRRVRRRANNLMAICSAVPGVALLAIAVFAFRAANQLMTVKLPPAG